MSRATPREKTARTLGLWIAPLLLSGCYLAHERPDVPAPDPIPPSLCPTPDGGDGRELVLLHRIGTTTMLSTRSATGELRTVTDELPDPGLSARLEVSPGGRFAVIGYLTDELVLVELDGGAVHLLDTILPASALALCGGASDLPGTPNGFFLQFRPDGRAMIYACGRYDASGRLTQGAWEIDLDAIRAREIAVDCATAEYPVNAPCDTQVTWSECPASDSRLPIRSELRPLDGSPPRRLGTRSWMLSRSAYLTLEGEPSALVAVDPAGTERPVFTDLEPTRPFGFSATARPDGSALVHVDGLGYSVVTVDGAHRAIPSAPCVSTTMMRTFTTSSVSDDGLVLISSCIESMQTYAMDLRTGAAPVEIPSLDGIAGYAQEWSADGGYFLMIPSFRTVAAVRVSRTTGESLAIELRDPDLGEILDVRFAHPAR
jgi:hypothetical protein